MVVLSNPFESICRLSTLCPFCEQETKFECPHNFELNSQMYGCRVDFIPNRFLGDVNAFAPFTCTICGGLFYIERGNGNHISKSKMFFGESSYYDGISTDFPLVYNALDVNSIFFIRGTFGTGKSYLAQKILMQSPKKTSMAVLEVEDMAGVNCDGFTACFNCVGNQTKALAKFSDLLQKKTKVIIVVGLLTELREVEDYLGRIEEAPLNYGVQVINLNRFHRPSERANILQNKEVLRKAFQL